MGKVTNQAEPVRTDFPVWETEGQSDSSMGSLSEERRDLGHLEEWGRVKCPGVHRLLSCRRGITHKVLWSTGLGEISLGQRHLSTSALGKVLRVLGKVDVLFLRSCLQGHTLIFQRRSGKRGLGSCLCLHSSGDDVGKRSVEIEE